MATASELWDVLNDVSGLIPANHVANDVVRKILADPIEEDTAKSVVDDLLNRYMEAEKSVRLLTAFLCSPSYSNVASQLDDQIRTMNGMFLGMRNVAQATVTNSTSFS